MIIMNEMMSLWRTFGFDLMNETMTYWHRIFEIDVMNEILIRWWWFEIDL